MTLLTKDQLLTSFPDNTAGDIVAENMRDFVDSNGSKAVSITSSAIFAIPDIADSVIFQSGSATGNLPSIADFKNRPLILDNRSGGNITINPDGSETIGGVSSLLIPDGIIVAIFGEISQTDWQILSTSEISFTQLTDTPSSYSGASLQGVRVNTGETGLEFFDVFDIQQATATGSTTESSAAFQVVSGMTITPGAGNYLVCFSGSWENDSNNRVIFLAIFQNGVEVAQSEVRLDIRNADTPMPVSTHALITGLGDSQDIDIRWSASGTGTRTMHERTLTLLKVSE